MRTHFKKPGFEFIFALSLIAIICLPPLVFAQGTKNMEIRITNGDTVVNGKNIKELSATERQQALKDINNLGDNLNGPAMNKNIIIERRRLNKGSQDNTMADQFRSRDSSKAFFKLRMDRGNGKDSMFTFNYKMNDEPRMRMDDRRMMGDREWSFDGPRRREGMEMKRRNTQSFNYTNTGTDGISTHVSFRVTDASLERTKEITGSDKSDLEIKDLNLVPEFSSGKTMLMFTLPSKAVAEVKFTDNEGKQLWSEKAMNGSFHTSFGLGLNGVYYLQVKQGGKVVLKRIIKEE
jgi:hypothetical protein